MMAELDGSNPRPSMRQRLSRIAGAVLLGLVALVAAGVSLIRREEPAPLDLKALQAEWVRADIRKGHYQAWTRVTSAKVTDEGKLVTRAALYRRGKLFLVIIPHRDAYDGSIAHFDYLIPIDGHAIYSTPDNGTIDMIPYDGTVYLRPDPLKGLCNLNTNPDAEDYICTIRTKKRSIEFGSCGSPGSSTRVTW